MKEAGAVRFNCDAHNRFKNDLIAREAEKSLVEIFGSVIQSPPHICSIQLRMKLHLATTYRLIHNGQFLYHFTAVC